MFKRIDTVFVYVKNLEKATKWYQEILGLEIAMEYPGYVAFKLSETYLTLIEEDTQINRKHSSFNLYVEDIQIVHQHLRKNEVKTSEIRQDGVFHFFFYDLDGNRLEVCSF